MLRILMIVSGGFEAVFGASAIVAPDMLIGALGTEAGASAVFFARILGAATLALGIAALLARNALATQGGLTASYGLALYNVLAAGLILWTAAMGGLGNAALWGAGLRNPVPPALESQASVVGMGSAPIRFWGDQLPPNADAIVKEKWAQVRASRPQLLANGHRPVVNFLALSGGGSDGAFGAGILPGWTASGKRPEFDIVTGVSTGALTAPFAFLGPRYDGALKQVFTESDSKDIAIAQPIRGLLGGDSLASNAPLAKVVGHYVTDEFLREVAAEHLKGRRLLIGTTNLDAERPVIWDMGAIAASGRPEALEVFRTVLLSSAAIPAVFPPGFIKVDADGGVYDEMHVDGGATREVFLVPTRKTAWITTSVTYRAILSTPARKPPTPSI